MHLDHKSPWNATARHLVLIRSNPSCTPPRSDLFWNKGYDKDAVAEKATLQKVQDHFIRVFISTIRDFAATGVNLLASLALEIYILINLYGAINELPGGNKGRLSILEMQRLLDVLGGDALSDYDYPAQNIPHRAY